MVKIICAYLYLDFSNGSVEIELIFVCVCVRVHVWWVCFHIFCYALLMLVQTVLSTSEMQSVAVVYGICICFKSSIIHTVFILVCHLYFTSVSILNYWYINMWYMFSDASALSPGYKACLHTVEWHPCVASWVMCIIYDAGAFHTLLHS